MTIKELAQEIQVHDHFHQMSDDNRYYLRGRAHYELIQNELKLKFAKTSDRCIFWNQNAPHNAQYRKEYINQLIELGD